MCEEDANMKKTKRNWIAISLVAVLCLVACCAHAEPGDPWGDIGRLLEGAETTQPPGEPLEALYLDPVLRAAVEAAARKAAGKPDGAITQDDLSRISELDLYDLGISDVGPLKGLTNLTSLDLSHNQIQDVTPLRKLKKLTSLDLSANLLTDISPLEGLGGLTNLVLSENEIVDTSPLWALKEAGCYIVLRGNPTDEVLRHSPKPTPETSPTLIIIPTPTAKPTPSPTSTPNPYAVIFPNADHEAAVRDAMGIQEYRGDITKDIAGKVKGLRISDRSISDISYLIYFKHIRSLDLSNNKIKDITVLSDLTDLEYLNLSNNEISNIEPLTNLDHLKVLFLDGNPIQDYSPVASFYYKLKGNDFTLTNLVG